jgi:hypothetical protein
LVLAKCTRSPKTTEASAQSCTFFAQSRTLFCLLLNTIAQTQTFFYCPISHFLVQTRTVFHDNMMPNLRLFFFFCQTLNLIPLIFTIFSIISPLMNSPLIVIAHKSNPQTRNTSRARERSSRKICCRLWEAMWN